MQRRYDAIMKMQNTGASKWTCKKEHMRIEFTIMAIMHVNGKDMRLMV